MWRRWKALLTCRADVTGARAALAAARSDRPRVLEVAARAETLREKNGFAAAIIRAMGGERDDS